MLHGCPEPLNCRAAAGRTRVRPRPTIIPDGDHSDGPDYPRQGRDHRLRPGRLHRGDLCRPRDAQADPDPGHPARRSDDHHDRRRELSGLCRRHPGPLADGADAEAGRACRHRDSHRPREQGRPLAAAVPARMRQRRRLSRRRADRRHRRAGALARSAVRTEVQGLWRLRLRHLRRLLLSRQGSDRDRRRQHGGRGSAVPHQFRFQDHGGAPARHVSAPKRFCRTACSAIRKSRCCGTPCSPM